MTRRPRFEVVRTAAGWHARCRATNGQIVWVTEVYTRKRAARRAISILRAATVPAVSTATVTPGVATYAASASSTTATYRYETPRVWMVLEVDER